MFVAACALVSLSCVAYVLFVVLRHYFLFCNDYNFQC